MTLVAECSKMIFMFNLLISLEVEGTHGEGHVGIEDVEFKIHIPVIHFSVFIERSYAYVSVRDLQDACCSVVCDLRGFLGVDSVEESVGKPSSVEVEVQLAEVLVGVDAVYLQSVSGSSKSIVQKSCACQPCREKLCDIIPPYYGRIDRCSKCWEQTSCIGRNILNILRFVDRCDVMRKGRNNKFLESLSQSQRHKHDIILLLQNIKKQIKR